MKTKTEKFLKAGDKLDILNKIMEKHDWFLTPEILVEEASDEDHPLHNYFEWDDSVAAHQYRLQQAAFFIRTVKIKVEIKNNGEKKWVRAIVNVRPEQDSDNDLEHFVDVDETDEDQPVAISKRGRQPGVYMGMREALNNSFYREQILSQAKSELRSFQSKYRTLQELSGVIEQIDLVLEAV